VPGVHNVLNATAAVGVALELDIPAAVIKEGLEAFAGVDRRFSIRGRERGITVVDDYGHHPTEIKATLTAAQLANFSRVLVLFQPHRFSRTMHLLDEFGTAFHQADEVYLLDIYAASEKPIEGLDSHTLLEKVRIHGHRSAHYAASLEEGVKRLIEAARPGDVIITLGAGNVSQASEMIIEKLREAAA
jgi:UDP-N-acetylmuramate--alanine ligase